MRIINRYLLREFAESWIAVTAVLLLILIGNSFLFIFRKVGSGDIPPDAVAPFLFSNTVMFLVGIIPFSLYLGVLLGFGRLYRDSEMAALGACGVGGLGLYRPVLLLCAPAVAVVAFLTFVATPWAARIEQAAKTQVESRSELSGIEAGRFNESRDGRSVLFVAGMSDAGERMRDVFIHGPDPDGGRGLEKARSARQETVQGHSFIVLEDGVRFVGEPGAADYRVIDFARHGVRIPQSTRGQASLRRAGKSVQELLASPHKKDHAELQWRFSLIAASVLLALLAVPLSHTSPRKGRYGRLALAVVVYLTYWNLLVVSKSWFGDGTTPAVIGMWWAHVPLLLLALALIWLQGGRRIGRAA